jgi:hypothetical protein
MQCNAMQCNARILYSTVQGKLRTTVRVCYCLVLADLIF